MLKTYLSLRDTLFPVLRCLRADNAVTASIHLLIASAFIALYRAISISRVQAPWIRG